MVRRRQGHFIPSSAGAAINAVINITVMKTRIAVFARKAATPTDALRYRGQRLLRHSNNTKAAVTVAAMIKKCCVTK